MKKSKITLRKIFGSEMAQHDPFFTEYSLTRNDLIEDLMAEENDLLVINAARGSGKSGLLLEFEESLRKSNKGYVVFKKYYADMVFPKNAISVSKGIDFWKNYILGLIVSSFGADKSFAISDDDMASVEFAEYIGEKPLNVVSAILKRIKFKGSLIEKCQFDPNLNINTLSRIVASSKHTYWILFDEMDDIYDNNDDINILIGLLQASSYIASRFANVRMRLTIRPHIMTFLRTSNGTIQKLSECEMKISWNKDQLRSILAKRLDFYERNNSSIEQGFLKLESRTTSNDRLEQETSLIASHFDDFDMSFQPERKSNYRAFGTLCFYRPRWMIEFCKEVAAVTPEGKVSSLFHYKKAFVPFGNRRIQFITGEFSKIYPYIQVAMTAMVGARQAGFGKTKKLRSTIINRIIKTGIVDAEEEHHAQKALEIAQALYKVEFLRGKERIAGGGDYHRFYYYTDRPDLLSSWGHEPQIVWEIHPTFVRAFNISDSGAYIISDEVKLAGKKNKEIEQSESKGNA
jgi:hypothetical protein